MKMSHRFCQIIERIVPGFETIQSIAFVTSQSPSLSVKPQFCFLLTIVILKTVEPVSLNLVYEYTNLLNKFRLQETDNTINVKNIHRTLAKFNAVK